MSRIKRHNGRTTKWERRADSCIPKLPKMALSQQELGLGADTLISEVWLQIWERTVKQPPKAVDPLPSYCSNLSSVYRVCHTTAALKFRNPWHPLLLA